MDCPIEVSSLLCVAEMILSKADFADDSAGLFSAALDDCIRELVALLGSAVTMSVIEREWPGSFILDSG